jgi:hypothetical protein
MLDYLKNYVLEGGYKVGGKSGETLKNALHDKAFLTWVNAYAEYMPDFNEKLTETLMNMSASRNDDLEIFRKGLIPILCAEKLELLQSRLEKAVLMPFEKYVKRARKYLPKGTRIRVDVYITVDPFNWGMMRPGKILLSIVQDEPTEESLKGLAHEFHHAGAFYWLSRNQKLNALKSSNEHAYMLAEVFTYFVTEGLANWYFSPWTTRTIEGDEEHNRVIKKLEKKMPWLIKATEQLLKWIYERHEPIEDIKALFKSISVDTSGRGIPAGHFLSGRMVGMMDDSNVINKEEIIELVKYPFDFFDLYNKVAAESGKLNVALLEKIKNKIEEWSTTSASNHLKSFSTSKAN